MKKQRALIHRDAVVESKRIGEGTRIWRNVHVLPGAVIGKHCNIGEGCYIENRVRIGNGVTIKNTIAVWDNIVIEDNVFVGPSVVFTNDLTPRAHHKKRPDQLGSMLIKKGATIGANATLVCGITIGEHAFIGAGSVVTKDIPSHHLVYGNPARFKGLVCRCAAAIPAGKSRFQCSCGLRYLIKGKKVVEVSQG